MTERERASGGEPQGAPPIGTEPSNDPHGEDAHARVIFDGIADDYELPAQAFSLFQYGRWRRRLVSRLGPTSGEPVLDICTGTGLFAAEIAGTAGCRAVGVNLSDRMIEQARRRLETGGIRAISFIQRRPPERSIFETAASTLSPSPIFWPFQRRRCGWQASPALFSPSDGSRLACSP